MASSIEQLLVEKPQEATPQPLGNCTLLDPSTLGISVALRGGRGMDIFWNYTRWEARDDILATLAPFSTQLFPGNSNSNGK